MIESKYHDRATLSGTESPLCFGPFEVDFRKWRLTRAGVPAKLQRKPFQILRILIERRGELVLRKELAALLWPELHVDYERCLNTAMNSLRQALGESARSGQHIQTCPGLGYRFTAHITMAPEFPTSRVDTVVAPVAASAAGLDYRKGVFFCHKMTADNLLRARAYFESALQTHFHFAPAHAALAEVACLLATWRAVNSAELGAQAVAHAETALDLDPDLAAAHAAMAAALWLLGDVSQSPEATLQRAIKHDPCCVSARVWYALWLAAGGRHVEAAEQIGNAAHLEPASLLVNYHAAWIMYVRRDYRMAVEHSWNTLMLEPAFAPAQYTLALAYEQLGMFEEAVTEFQNGLQCSANDPRMIAGLAHALAKFGDRVQAAELRRQLAYLVDTAACSPYWQALADIGAGHLEAAAHAIEKAAVNRDCLTVWLGVEPRFDPLRQSEAFQRCVPFR